MAIRLPTFKCYLRRKLYVWILLWNIKTGSLHTKHLLLLDRLTQSCAKLELCHY